MLEITPEAARSGTSLPNSHLVWRALPDVSSLRIAGWCRRHYVYSEGPMALQIAECATASKW